MTSKSNTLFVMDPHSASPEFILDAYKKRWESSFLGAPHKVSGNEVLLTFYSIK